MVDKTKEETVGEIETAIREYNNAMRRIQLFQNRENPPEAQIEALRQRAARFVEGVINYSVNGKSDTYHPPNPEWLQQNEELVKSMINNPQMPPNEQSMLNSMLNVALHHDEPSPPPKFYQHNPQPQPQPQQQHQDQGYQQESTGPSWGSAPRQQHPTEYHIGDAYRLIDATHNYRKKASGEAAQNFISDKASPATFALAQVIAGSLTSPVGDDKMKELEFLQDVARSERAMRDDPSKDNLKQFQLDLKNFIEMSPNSALSQYPAIKNEASLILKQTSKERHLHHSHTAKKYGSDLKTGEYSYDKNQNLYQQEEKRFSARDKVKQKIKEKATHLKDHIKPGK